MTDAQSMGADARPYHDGLARLFRANRAALGITDPIDALTTTTLGVGESNLSLRVDVNGRQRFTARLAYRPDAEAHLAREFGALTLLPAGVGPTPLYLDTSRREVSYPCAILSFVPGEPRADWSVEDLRAHAATLARLHHHQVPYWGSIGEEQERPFDMHQRFHESLDYWKAAYPYLFEIDVVARLVLRLDAYIDAHNNLFTSLPAFSLVHGDPCVPNILFDQGEVHYIDWEWMVWGDPALDVAQVGWDIANPPWQIALTRDRLDAYLQAYQAHRSDPTVRERREVWMAHLKFFDHLHYRIKSHQGQMEASDVSREQYGAAVGRISDSLVAQFLS